MLRRCLTTTGLIAILYSCAFAADVIVRAVNLDAKDGTHLKATFYNASASGPGILLFHQCNRDRKAWDGLARLLASSGFQVLTMDYRGYGESGGSRFVDLPQEQQRLAIEKWPSDVDIAFQYL